LRERTFGPKAPSRTHDPVTGEPSHAPRIAPAHGPPAWEPFDQTMVFAPVATVPEPAFDFDQTVTCQRRTGSLSTNAPFSATLEAVSLVSRLLSVAAAVPHTCPTGAFCIRALRFRPRYCTRA